jgi:allantoate deiminase
LADAVRGFGGDPDALADARRDPADLLGYYEVHIEQGPVLEAREAALGIVTGIAGQSRARVAFTGDAGHAGTVPMALRRDALCGAAEFVAAIEAAARSVDTPPAVLPDMWEKLQAGPAGTGLVATVGELEIRPGASNVIPGSATLSLDVRHTDDAVRESVATRLRERAGAIADARELELSWQTLQESRAVDCSPELTARLAEAVAASGYPVVRLPSGAGHDAVMLSTITPVAMLFVRCAGGVSHNPAESVTVEDVVAAIDATTRFLERVG